MPLLVDICSFADRLVGHGVGPSDVKALVGYVLNGAQAPNRLQTGQLHAITERYQHHFTEAGARAWRQLTGIDVTGQPRANATGSTTVRGLQLREASGRSVDTASGLEAAVHELLTPQLCLEVPPPASTMEIALRSERSKLLPHLMQRIRQLESDLGDNDGTLAPRDLRGAPLDIQRVMRAVYAMTRRRALPLSEIEKRLPAAVSDMLNSPRMRREPEVLPLYLEAVRETALCVIWQYRDKVLTGNEYGTPFARRMRLNSRRGGSFRAELRSLMKTDDPRLLSQTYQRALSGKLTMQRFFLVTGLNRTDLSRLQQEQPLLFPRAAGAGVIPGATWTRFSRQEVRRLAQAWREEVVEGGRPVSDFCRARDVPESSFIHVRLKHPQLFAPPPEREQRYANLVLARRLAHLQKRFLTQDPLGERKDFLAYLNRDTELVAAHGTFDMRRYQTNQTLRPSLFLGFYDKKRRYSAIAAAVRKALQQNPDLRGKALLAALKKEHPRLTYHTLRPTLLAYPDLVARRQRATPAQRRKDALRLKKLIAGDPQVRWSDLLSKLQAEDPRLTEMYVRGLLTEYGKGIIGVERIGTYAPKAFTDDHADGRLVRRLADLALEVAPPGTGCEEVGRIINQLIEARGLAPLPAASFKTWQSIPGGRDEDAVSFQYVTARRVSEIVAEYATAASRSASVRSIFMQIASDYPNLNLIRLTAWYRTFRRHIKDYPALSRFVRGGQLQLGGLGEPPARPRFIGGWDAARTFAGASHEEKARLARLSQAARIPIRLPMLDALCREGGSRRALSRCNIVWISHLLATTFPLAQALRKTGAHMAKTVVVGTPYGSNVTVRAVLEKTGFDVRVPALAMKAYWAEVERALDDIAEKHRQNGEPILILDDGGMAATLLHSKAKYAGLRKEVRIVEQTTGGIDLSEVQALQTPVINVARSRTKTEIESTFIGDAVAGKVMQGLARLGKELRGKKVLIMGFGVVGSAVAAAAERAGAEIMVVETQEKRAKQAAERYKVLKKSEALERADVVIGATGKCSLSLDELRQLKSGAVLASASSKQVEFDMEGLRNAATHRHVVTGAAPLLQLPTATYRLGKRELTVLGDGWPVNFDGDVEDIPWQHIQLTRALMLAGALQAVGVWGKGAAGLRDLDPKVDEKICELFAQTNRNAPRSLAIGDPERWADPLLEIAARFAPARGPTGTSRPHALRK